MEDVKLNQTQQHALDEMMRGENVFLTGDAGTGKTFVVQEFIKRARQKGKNVLVTATTGIAAINIGQGAMTVHRALEISINPDTYSREVSERCELLSVADVLIIDEISMCRFDLFNIIGKKIEFENDQRHVERFVRKEIKPDLQIIVTGDFFQLPPVTSKKDYELLSKKYGMDYGITGKYKYGYAFYSPYWRQMWFEPIELKEVIRQKDETFTKVLNCIKYKYNAIQAAGWLNLNSSKDAFENAPYLVGKNREAKERNVDKLNALPGEPIFFYASINGDVTEDDIKQVRNLAEKEITIKVGAQVMITVNAPDLSYVNGSIGTIVDIGTSFDDECLEILLNNGDTIFLKRTTWEIEEQKVVENNPSTENLDDLDDSDKKKIVITKKGTYSQFPIKLAWAISIHKSQGQTFDKVNINPRCWSPGQFYVAVSRAKDIKGIHFTERVKPNYIKTISGNDFQAYKKSFNLRDLRKAANED